MEPEASDVCVPTTAEREQVHFASGATRCAAWHYPGTNGACVIMAGGFAVPKEPATDLFAKRFNDAGFSVLAFDYRGLGQSGGRPRLVLPVRKQLADWQAAIGFAATLPEADPARLALWGFSASGGHVLRVAARDPRVAAVIAQTPNVGGPAATRSVTAHQKPLAMLRLTGKGLADALGGLAGRAPLLVPLAGEPGSVAMLTTPDAGDGPAALDPDHRHPHWQQQAAARSALRLAFYQPGRDTARVRCPLLVLTCDQDQTAPPGPAVRAARRAPRAELVHLPGRHYAPFMEMHEQAVDAELSFLRRHLLDHT
ncbi:alpha/beta fold hydrolase [Actinomadura sp. ATCC 31491]|uniref:Alpha/beta fold hydrolase n=1 Tax=Actinomadura luzonensis TaxID=2805427 RepID=A0ABT0G629_9ACTN|nr:alpha/beta hydrolase [Actinomadura luzonensis]MCK2220069.1 alpha/beta fold hydrolase [Actinomadura luzonensis]